MKRNDLTLNNNRWDIVKTHQMIKQGLLEYARIAWEIVCKEVSITKMWLGTMMKSKGAPRYSTIGTLQELCIRISKRPMLA